MKKFLAVIAFLALSTTAFAAVANNLAWDIVAPDVTTAQGYTYRIYIDGGLNGQVLTGVTCSGVSTITCQTTFPLIINGTPVSPGNHPVVVSVQPASGLEILSTSTIFQFLGPATNLRAK